MNDLIKILAIASTAIALSTSFPGCGESSESKPGETHSADEGHDHAGSGDDHEEHDHAEGDHDDHDHAEVEHGKMRSLGSVTIAGTTLAVSVSSDIKPSSEVHLGLEVESGPIPAAVRFWIGDEAGKGALRSKADFHDRHFHGQTGSPATITGASLWIEIETAEGERQAASVAID